MTSMAASLCVGAAIHAWVALIGLSGARRDQFRHFFLVAAVFEGASAALWWLAGVWQLGVTEAALAAILVWLWRKNGKRRGRVRKWLGAKSKAAVRVLAARMPSPRPVLRPVPQGSPS